jgi:demethylmenaquinone methyltransferase/2-methoxy-6-polyprenyl-1,4-benzoquinol methylase
LIQTLRSHPQLQDAVGVDLSERMLVHCREKLTRYNLAARATLQIGDALALPFADRSFDAVTMAFGIRNTADRCAALREMVRVLKPGGQAVILEFALPRSPWLRWVYLAYLRSVVPLVGGILSGRPSAYRYLNRTIEGFHSPGSFRALMLESGFARVDIVPLSWGTVCIYDGTLGDAAWPSRN